MRVEFGGLLRLGFLHIDLGDIDQRFQRRTALGDRGFHRLLIKHPGIGEGFHRLAGTDFGHQVFQVVGRLIGAAGRLHLHLQHGAQLVHRRLASDTHIGHFRQQFRQPLGHIGGFEAALLALKGNRFQRLQHRSRVGDLGALAQRADHFRRVRATGALADGKFRRRGDIGLGFLHLHAAGDQLVDQLGHLVARHAGRFRGVDHGLHQGHLLGGVGNIGLDRDVANDRLKIRTDLGRHRRQGGAGYRRADAAAQALPPFLHLAQALGLELGAAHYLAQRQVFLTQAPDLDALLAQAGVVGLQFAQQGVGIGRPAVVRPLPLLA
ncbi:hypothetical protein D9M71_335020 [compost metagenome]